MKKLAVVLGIMLSVLVGNAQEEEKLVRMTLTSTVYGPVMIDTLSAPNKLPSDVVFIRTTIFVIDLEEMTITKTTGEGSKTLNIDKIYDPFENGINTSRTFWADGFMICVTSTIDDAADSGHYLSVQESIDYIKENENPWYVNLYYVNSKDFKVKYK